MCLIIAVTAPSGEIELLRNAARKAAAVGLRVDVEHSPRWRWARDSQLK